MNPNHPTLSAVTTATTETVEEERREGSSLQDGENPSIKTGKEDEGEAR